MSLAENSLSRFHEVHWELTNHCNLKCVHCYLSEDQRRELTIHEIRAILDQLTAQGFLWLTFSGGEPLLRRDFPEIYSYAYDRGFQINVFNNGTRLRDEIIELFNKKPPYTIEITLNGITPETFEKVTGVKGSFEQCLAGIKKLYEEGHRLILKTNGMTLNAHEVKEIKKFALSLQGVQFKFDTAIMPRRDHDLSPTLLRLKPDQILALYEEDQMMKKEIQNQCGQATSYIAPEGKAFTCTAGKKRFHISPWGDLHPCSTVRPIKVSLLEHSLEQAMVILADMVDSVTMPKTSKCGSCKIFAQCASCPGLAHLEGTSFTEPVKDHCETTHEVMRTYGSPS